MIALLAAWAAVVLTEAVAAPRFTTFVVLWGLASAGPLVVTWLWARTGRTRPSGETRREPETAESRARRDLERERRMLGTLWLSALLAAIVATLLTRWLCPDAPVVLPMSLAGLLLAPTAVYTFLVRPSAST